MFLGEFQHSLDTKGRVILPAKYRDQLADGAFVTKGRGGCLSVFTPEEFETVASQIREQSKRGPKELNAARVFFGGASEIQPDKQGRVALPANLREFAHLEREVMVVGPVLPDRDLGPRPLARARPGGGGGPHRVRRPARLRDLNAATTIDNGEPAGPPPAPRAARRKRPFRPLRFRRCVRGAGGGPGETRTTGAGARPGQRWPRPSQHLPVMAAEVVDLLAAVPTGLVVDATVGGGGHARALLDRPPRPPSPRHRPGSRRRGSGGRGARTLRGPGPHRAGRLRGRRRNRRKPTSWETRESWRSCSTWASAARSSTVPCGASRTGPTPRRSTCGWTACRR